MLHPIMKAATLADEENGRIWSIGGDRCGSHYSGVDYLDMETKTWTHHSNVNTANVLAACGFVTKKTGARWILCVLGHPQGSQPFTYYDLTHDSGWHVDGQMFHSSFYQFHMMLQLNRNQ